MSEVVLKNTDSTTGIFKQVERPAGLQRLADRVTTVGRFAIPYSLVVVLVYIGAMKFTSYEAEGISGMVGNSPLMAWSYSLFSVRAFSAIIGVSELLIAVLISMRPWSPKASAFGSLLAVGMFLTTLSFLFSTPGVIESSVGFPALSVIPGQFILKDFVLLSAAIWSFGDSLKSWLNAPHF
jgi:uncharacterized membrane protein YkgB